MNETGYAVSVLHSGLSTEERDSVMEDFMDQRTRVLITTNVLARGVNVPAVKVVINFDLPVIHPGPNGGVFQPDPESYVHRICRTGRFGRRGIAISFCETEEDFENLEYIQRYHMEKNSGDTFITEWDPNNLDELNEKLIELEQREDEYDELLKVVDKASL
jgi:ATP-dependent RNA helicase DDX19/DBP5